jgi:hypothetical protein
MLVTRCNDLTCLKGFLGTKVETSSVGNLLEFLIGQGLIVQGTDLLDLRQLFGLEVAVL